MPDITMCGGHNDQYGDCPKKNECYRHVARPSEFRQSYFMQAPIYINDENKSTCDYFWDKDSR